MRYAGIIVLTAMFAAAPHALAECSAQRIVSEKSTFSTDNNGDVPVLRITTSDAVGEWSFPFDGFRPGKPLVAGGVTFNPGGETGDILIFDLKSGGFVPRPLVWIGCQDSDTSSSSREDDLLPPPIPGRAGE